MRVRARVRVQRDLRDGHASREEALANHHHAAHRRGRGGVLLGGALALLPAHHAAARGVDVRVAVEQAGLGHAHPVEGDPEGWGGGVVEEPIIGDP